MKTFSSHNAATYLVVNLLSVHIALNHGVSWLQYAGIKTEINPPTLQLCNSRRRVGLCNKNRYHTSTLSRICFQRWPGTLPCCWWHFWQHPLNTGLPSQATHNAVSPPTLSTSIRHIQSPHPPFLLYSTLSSLSWCLSFQMLHNILCNATCNVC
jgi:hypothetical protein